MTTYIIGQDGSSFAPASPATLDYMRRYTAGFNGNPPGLAYDWRTVDEYLARFDRRAAINVAYLIPNGNVRMEVMGLDPRPATDDELRAMQTAGPRGDGRRGGRAVDGPGLHPQPAMPTPARSPRFASRSSPENGVYVTHMRGYGPRAAVGMREVYDIAQATGVPAHISHYNGPADLLLPLIDQGRALGLDLTFDTYPYLAGEHDPGHGRAAGLGPGRRDRRDRRAAPRPGVRARLNSEWFSAPTPYPLDRITIAMVANPDWRWAEGQPSPRPPSRRSSIPATSSARSCRPRAWPWASWASARAIGPRPTSARSSDIPRTWRAPTASSAAAFPTRAAGGPSPATWATTPASSAITPGPRR